MTDLSQNTQSGRVLKYTSNAYTVETQAGVFQCSMKGVLKKAGTSVYAGDYVNLDSVDTTNQTARITEVRERQSELHRPKVANVDQIIIVQPLREPDFDFQQLDRFCTHVSLSGLPYIICISKSDLCSEDDPLRATITNIYQEQLQIPVLFSSIHDTNSISKLIQHCHGKLNVMAGLSGAGKSSLMNAINPELNLQVQEVSEKISRGQHTTRHVEIINVTDEIQIADTPGFSQLVFECEPSQVEAVMGDFAPFRKQCRFSNCLHIDEEDCAVQNNLSTIAGSRYESYKAFLAEARAWQDEQSSMSQKEEYGKKTLHAKGKKGKKDLDILRLKGKDRSHSRKTEKQSLSAQDWTSQLDED